MGASNSVPAAKPAEALSGAVDSNETKKSPPKCKACCACPETKRARDACIVENGEENCRDLIEAHLKCMRDMGFKI